MSTQDEDRRAGQRFARAAGGLLRQGADELDAATLSRLNRARQAALAEHDRARRRPAWLAGSGWQAAAAVAAMAVVAVGLWTGRMAPPAAPGGHGATAVAGDVPRPEQATDLEVVVVDDSLDLIEDLEFYEWVDSGGNDTAGADLTG